MTKTNFELEIGKYYRHKHNPKYGWAKILEIGYFGKTYKIAKCEWSIGKNEPFGFIKHIRLSDLVKE